MKTLKNVNTMILGIALAPVLVQRAIVDEIRKAKFSKECEKKLEALRNEKEA